jgi:hypothetical protein
VKHPRLQIPTVSDLALSFSLPKLRPVPKFWLHPSSSQLVRQSSPPAPPASIPGCHVALPSHFPRRPCYRSIFIVQKDVINPASEHAPRGAREHPPSLTLCGIDAHTRSLATALQVQRVSSSRFNSSSSRDQFRTMATAAKIPLPYILFFHWIEPVATLAGAYYAWLKPTEYLQLTHAASAPGLLGLPVATHVVLRQLGNLYVAFTLNEALVLRATNDLKVWRALLVVLLIADFGHLYSCFPLGLHTYYDVANWNAMAYGNYFFVYCGATTRICFLLNVGMGGVKKAKSKAKKSVRMAIEDAPPVTPTQMNKTPAQSTRRKKNRSS